MSDYSLALSDTIDIASDRRLGAPAYTSEGDAALLERFQGGDNGALVELFDRHNRRLHVYCMKIIGSRDLARDMVQELWVRVLELRRKPRSIETPIAFFMTIARNLCLNHIKGRKHHAPLGQLPESAHPTDDSSDGTEMQRTILASLELLPFDDRELLVLNIYCGYRLEEIAEMYGKSPEALWKRASRARKRLREIVEKETGSQLSR